MSLIIKGMSLPSGCNMCQLHVLCFDYYVCRAKKLERGGYLDVDDQVIAGIRHRCCPLVEIPTPHGRLIDADRLLVVLKSMASTNQSVPTEAVLGLIDHQPVIIEEERIK